MRTITIVTPCFNEEDNIQAIYVAVKNIFSNFPQYQYQHLFIDNCSEDGTVAKIRQLLAHDNHLQLIVNNRNFGPIRSPFHGLLQSTGDAVILIAADLQEPPDLIPEFLQKWELGAQAVVGIRKTTKGSQVSFWLRRLYYKLITKMSEVPLLSNFTGFGLYDKSVIQELRKLKEPYPYFRGLITELGFKIEKVFFSQPRRERGISKANFYSLYDYAVLGFTSHSKVPLRLAAMGGFLLSFISLLISIGYVILKMLFWKSFSLGLAPIVIGLFFFSSVQLFFIGMLGEYILQILMQVKARPLVVERERVNMPDHIE